MYRLVLYNVIFGVLAVATMMNCMKGNKKGSGAKKSQKSTPPTPITYETDPIVLEKERKLKIQENREKMRKKREKNTLKSLEDSKTLSGKKSKELDMLPEDKTQSTTESSDSKEAAKEDTKDDKTMGKTQDLSSKKKESSMSNEELGDIQLVDNDLNASKKMKVLKEQAKDNAKQKQMEEIFAQNLDKSEQSTKVCTPDDTLRNISSIQFESQTSAVQRRKSKDNTKTNNDTTESLMVKEAVIVDPKSNPMYLREFTQHVLRGSMEPDETGTS